MNRVSEGFSAPKTYTVDEMIDTLNEIKNHGKGHYKMIWGAGKVCTGYPIIAVTIKDTDNEVCV